MKLKGKRQGTSGSFEMGSLEDRNWSFSVESSNKVPLDFGSRPNTSAGVAGTGRSNGRHNNNNSENNDEFSQSLRNVSFNEEEIL